MICLSRYRCFVLWNKPALISLREQTLLTLYHQSDCLFVCVFKRFYKNSYTCTFWPYFFLIKRRIIFYWFQSFISHLIVAEIRIFFFFNKKTIFISVKVLQSKISILLSRKRQWNPFEHLKNFLTLESTVCANNRHFVHVNISLFFLFI